MPLYVPQLARKLGCLYQHHESLNTHERLAECLGIAPNNISTWVNGNEIRSRGFVPDKHVKRIADLFHIPVQLLEMDSLERFKTSVDSPKSKEGAWQSILQQAITTQTIRLVLKEPSSEVRLTRRGLIAENSEIKETFQLGDLLYIQIALDSVWANRAKNENVHLLLLSKDRNHTSCLCPSPIAPVTDITCTKFMIPDKAPKKCLKIEGPSGSQSILALLTQRPFSLDLYSMIESEDTNALDRVAQEVSENLSLEWQLLQKEYEVI